jgi:hypothetical protein
MTTSEHFAWAINPEIEEAAQNPAQEVWEQSRDTLHVPRSSNAKPLGFPGIAS